MEDICRANGFDPPIIYTPQELLEGQDMRPDDPIMAELRAIRDAFAQKYGDDLEALAGDVNEAAAKSGVVLESMPPKRIPPEEPTRQEKASN